MMRGGRDRRLRLRHPAGLLLRRRGAAAAEGSPGFDRSARPREAAAARGGGAGHNRGGVAAGLQALALAVGVEPDAAEDVARKGGEGQVVLLTSLRGLGGRGDGKGGNVEEDMDCSKLVQPQVSNDSELQ